MRIVLADDHNLFRGALARGLRDSTSGMEFIEARDGHEAIHLVTSTKVDLLILDIRMPRVDGVEVVRIVREKALNVRIIILTQYDQSYLILNLLKMGINGFLRKSCEIDELIHTINEVKTKGEYFDSFVIDIVQSNLRNISRLPRIRYSVREYQIVNFLKEGKSSKEISVSLGLSPHSVDSYRKNIMKKTNTKNIADLISFSYEVGVL